MKTSILSPFFRKVIFLSGIVAAIAPMAASANSLDGTSDLAPSTTISEKTEAPLKKLSAALTKTSGEDCAAIEKSKNGYSLDTIRCLPAPVRRLIGLKSTVAGSNCYNLANMTAELQPFVRYVSENEINFFLHPFAGYCTEVKGQPHPGNYAMILGRSEGETVNVHGYIYLTDEFAITKNGPQAEFPWKIGRVSEIRKKYQARVRAKTKPLSGRTELVYYQCSDKGAAKDPALQSMSEPLKSFGQAMEAPMLKKPVTLEMVRAMSRGLSEVQKAFTPAVVKAIDSSKDKFEGAHLLLEIYAHISAFGYIDPNAKGGFQNRAAISEYLKVREAYRAFIFSVVEQTGSIEMISDELLQSSEK